MSDVKLGFLEKCEPWQLESRLFPSKVGGKPAWLDLENLPNSEQLECKKCHRPMIFLCQIYAPYEEDVKNFIGNFHRMLFVFICRNPECCQRNNSDNLKVFRSSLPRKNKFYSYDPPEEKPTDFSLNRMVKLCNVCGCLAEKQCKNCKNAQYCTREHQIMDWKEGHKRECNTNGFVERMPKILFSQLEIIIESEEIDIKAVNEEEELQKFYQLEREGRTGKEVSETELEMYATAEKDEAFATFKKRISSDPVQVIRYHKAGEPLWIAKEPLPICIPNCKHCGGPRRFEFQIMPQMLYELKEHELDWGVIVIYTCASSCIDGNSNYKEEFVFKQDVELKN